MFQFLTLIFKKGWEKYLPFLLRYKFQLFILLLATFYAYDGLWKTFFLADMWQILGTYPLLKSYGLSYFFQLFAMPYGIHFVPLGIFINTLEIFLFGMNAFWYGILSFIFHFINVLLLFYTILRITKHRTISLLGALFFGVNYSIREGVFWYASDPMVELCTSFVLLGLIQFMTFYNSKNKSAFFLSFFFFILALLLYEYMYMLFFVILFFLVFAFFKEREKKYLFFTGLYLFVIIAYGLLRFFYVHATSAMIVSNYDRHLVIMLLWGILTLSPKLITAILLPQEWILFLSNFISQNIYSNIDIAQTAVFKTVIYYDQIDIFIGFLSLFTMVCIFVNAKKIMKEKRFAIFLYGISFLIYPAVFLTLSAYLYWIYSRYLYLQTALFLICLCSVLSLVSIFRYKNSISFLISIICVIFICSHAYLNHEFFVSYDAMSYRRLHIVQRVYHQLNFTNKEEVIYIKTVNGGYSNTGDIFDIGTSFGKELLIWSWFQNNNKNKISSCLFNPLFLFSSPVNGYEQCDGHGYGYFQDILQLAKTVKKYKIDVHNIAAIEYNSKTDTLTSINQEIQDRIKKE